jgi:hypothetical protein
VNATLVGGGRATIYRAASPEYDYVMNAAGPTPEQVLSETIAEEAQRLQAAAGARSLTLRLTGSLAIKVHSAQHAHLLARLGRRPYRDVDFFGLSKEQRGLERLFESLGYVGDVQMKHAREWGVKRLIYEHPDTSVKVDVFMDELVMAHTIDFKHRLGLDEPTVCLSDLLLSKLQIHEITQNDLIDITVLMAEHDLGQGDRERIDVERITGTLRNDWGFYYTASENLKKVEDSLDGYSNLPSNIRDTVRIRLHNLAGQIESTPKTMKWKMRARVGTRAKWYEDVEEVKR